MFTFHHLVHRMRTSMAECSVRPNNEDNGLVFEKGSKKKVASLGCQKGEKGSSQLVVNAPGLLE